MATTWTCDWTSCYRHCFFSTSVTQLRCHKSRHPQKKGKMFLFVFQNLNKGVTDKKNTPKLTSCLIDRRLEIETYLFLSRYAFFGNYLFFGPRVCDFLSILRHQHFNRRDKVLLKWRARTKKQVRTVSLPILPILYYNSLLLITSGKVSKKWQWVFPSPEYAKEWMNE